MTRLRTRQPRGLRGPQVYEKIKDLIRTGGLGIEMPVSENEIARRLEVSRTPVREALLRLKSEGWLVERDGKGLVVRALTEAEIGEIYILREALEGAAARLAARSASQPELLALKEVSKAFEEAARRDDDVQELERINARFHALLYRSSNSEILGRILEPLQNLTRRLPQSIFVYPSRAKESARDHVEMVAAVVDRDERRAEDVARAHVSRAREVREMLMAEALVGRP